MGSICRIPGCRRSSAAGRRIQPGSVRAPTARPGSARRRPPWARRRPVPVAAPLAALHRAPQHPSSSLSTTDTNHGIDPVSLSGRHRGRGAVIRHRRIVVLADPVRKGVDARSRHQRRTVAQHEARQGVRIRRVGRAGDGLQPRRFHRAKSLAGVRALRGIRHRLRMGGDGTRRDLPVRAAFVQALGDQQRLSDRCAHVDGRPAWSVEMKRRFRALALASMAASTCASAETNNVTATGFTVTQAREVNAPPEKVWASLTHVEDWWSGAHTWSGKASNLSFDLRAGGCWCEKWEGASVLHGTVAFIQEGKVLRFYANLGPLQDRATNGVLTFALGVAKEKT